jgi:hypothetical protein
VRRKPLLWYAAAASTVVGATGFFATGFFSSHAEFAKRSQYDSQALLFWLLAAAGVVYLGFTQRRQALRGSGPDQGEPARADAVRRSGSALASAKALCRPGGPSVSGQSLLVTVCPGGIVAKARFAAEGAILASEIQGVWISHQWRQDRLVVVHEAVGMPSPLVIWTSIDTPLGAAIRALAPASPAGGPPPDRLELHGLSRVGGLFMVAWGLGFVVLGLVMIPSLGPFGVLWTAGAALITYHAARMVFPGLPLPAFLRTSVETVTPPSDPPGQPR